MATLAATSSNSFGTLFRSVVGAALLLFAGGCVAAYLRMRRRG